MKLRKVPISLVDVLSVVVVLLYVGPFQLGVGAEELRGENARMHLNHQYHNRELSMHKRPEWLQELMYYITSAIKKVNVTNSTVTADSSPPPVKQDTEDINNQDITNLFSESMFAEESPRQGKGSKNVKQSSKVKGTGVDKSRRSKGKGKRKGASDYTDNPLSTAPSSSSAHTPEVVVTMNPATVAPNPQPVLTFAPFSTLSPATAPAAVTFAPFSPLLPTNLPMSVLPETRLPDSLQPATDLPTTSPPVSQLQSVAIEPYYIAYSAPLADREPTTEEYELMNQLTTSYFEEILGVKYSSSTDEFGVISLTIFDSVNATITETKYETGIPEPSFNIYIAFTTEVVFASESTYIPESNELFDVMMESINPTYIVNYVWQASDTPFISTQDATMNITETSIIVDSPRNIANPDVETFGRGSIGEKQSEPPQENISYSGSGSSFGLGVAFDRGYSEHPLRERFVLPDSIITSSIFREEDNVGAR